MVTIAKQLLFVVLVVFLTHGCLSQIGSMDEYTKNWVGRSIEEYHRMGQRSETYAKHIKWKEKTYFLSNGNQVYIEPIRKECFIHWEVNSEGIIVGYRTDGVRCY